MGGEVCAHDSEPACVVGVFGVAQVCEEDASQPCDVDELRGSAAQQSVAHGVCGVGRMVPHSETLSGVARSSRSAYGAWLCIIGVLRLGTWRKYCCEEEGSGGPGDSVHAECGIGLCIQPMVSVRIREGAPQAHGR